MIDRLPLGPHGLVAVAVVVAPLAIGSAHVGTRVGLAACVALALLWGVVVANRRLKFDSVAWALTLAFGWTCLQLLPLPASLVEMLGAPSAEAHRAAATALGFEASSWVPLSIHPGATADMALYLFAAAGAYLVASNSRAGRRRFLVKAVAAVGLAVVLIGVGHKMLHATALFGVYEPQMALASLPFPTTLINANHAAALMLIAGTSAAALALSGDSKRGVPAYWGIALACAAGVVATRSMACTVLLGGIVVALLAERWRRGQEFGATSKWVFAGLGVGVVVAAAVAVVVLGGETLTARWELGSAAARDYWTVGVGAGGFPMVASQYQVNWADGQLTYAHNGLLQGVIDWGAPIALAVLALLLHGIWQAVRWTGSSVHYLAVVFGVVAIGAANLVEFSLWLPGVGLPALVLLAWPAGEARRLRERARAKAEKASVRSSEKRASVRLSVPARGAVAGLIVGVLALAPWALGDTMEGSHAQARAIVSQGSAGDSEAAASLLNLAAKHPSDFFVWWSAARTMAQQDPERAQPSIGRALVLAPHHPQTLQLCALYSPREAALGCLTELSQKSLKLRYRSAQIAIARGGGGDGTPTFAQAFASRRGISALAVADTLKRGEGLQAYEQALLWAYREHPTDPLVAERLVLLWLDDGDRTPALNGLSTALLARGATLEDPESAAGLRRLGYLALGAITQRKDRDARTAAQAFEAAAREVPDHAELPLERAIQAWIVAGEATRAEPALARLQKIAKAKSATKQLRARAHELTAQVAQANGDLEVAIAEVRRALAYEKNSARLHQTLARLFIEQGSPTLAQQALQKAAKLGAAQD